MDNKTQGLEHLLAEALLEKKDLEIELKQITDNRDYWKSFYYKKDQEWVEWCNNEEQKIKEKFGIKAENLQETLDKLYKLPIQIIRKE